MNTPKKLDPKLREMLVNIAKTESTNIDLASEAQSERRTDLRELFRRLEQRHVFRPGMLVRWKSGLRNARIPAYGQEAVVVEVLGVSLFDESMGPGFTYYREPLDLVLGIQIPDGDLLLWHFDSRRFEPCPGEDQDR
jgi:hypothetical protein